jgi:hypothetical protein
MVNHTKHKTLKKTLKNKKISEKKKITSKNVFMKKDFSSNDGMLTSIWGPGLWHFLHTMSFNYPVKPRPIDKKKYKSFILNLKYTLPCKYCRINLVKNLKHLPLIDKHMKNRYTFSKYVYELHEHINTMLNKTSNLSYDDVRERYEHFRARCTEKQVKDKLFKYNKTKKENGCVEPLYGIKSKCILKIVPQKSSHKTFTMNKTCKKRRLTL